MQVGHGSVAKIFVTTFDFCRPFINCFEQTAVHNVHLKAEWVSTGDNGKADALSRLDFERFWSLESGMDHIPQKLPQDIWPITKVWINN